MGRADDQRELDAVKQSMEATSGEKAAALEQANLEAERKQLDETREGGEYLLSDGKTRVNANGEPLKANQ